MSHDNRSEDEVIDEIKAEFLVAKATVKLSPERALAHYGFSYPDQILRAREAAKVGLPLACAVLMQETAGGRNEWGHDPTIFIGGHDAFTGIHWGETVTERAYLAYRAESHRTGKQQGCGSMQLTSRGLQDQADKAGGCWVPQHNIAVGLHYLHDLILEHGLRAGVAAYNGSGPLAQSYSERVVALAQHYKAEGLGSVIGILK